MDGRRTSTNPNQREDSANGSEDLLCGEGLDRVPVQDIDFVVDVQYLGPARARRHCYRPGVGGTRRTVEVLSEGYGRS